MTETNNKSENGIVVFDAKKLMAGEDVVYQGQGGEMVKLNLNIIRTLASVGDGINLSDRELLIFANTCVKYCIDPALNQAYLIKYSKTDPAQNVIAAQFYNLIADSAPGYLGNRMGWIISDGDYKTDGGHQYVEIEAGVKSGWKIVGAWAQILHATRKFPVVPVFTDEVLKKKRDGTITRFWKDQPITQLLKCALARGQRTSFPNLYPNAYSTDEIPMDSPALNAAPDAPQVKPRGERNGEKYARTIEGEIKRLSDSLKEEMKLRRIDESKAQIILQDWVGFVACQFNMVGDPEIYGKSENWRFELIDKMSEDSVPDEIWEKYKPKKEEESVPAHIPSYDDLHPKPDDDQLFDNSPEQGAG